MPLHNTFSVLYARAVFCFSDTLGESGIKCRGQKITANYSTYKSETVMKIIISGICGRMGQTVASLAKEGCHGAELVCGVDKRAIGDFDIVCLESFDMLPHGVSENADCIVDFSHHSNTAELLDYAVKTELPVIIGTTGQNDDEMKIIRGASKKIAVFLAPNCSLGIALLAELARQVAIVMPDAEIEIVERHHDRKADAPSGTAYALADVIRSVRPNIKNNAGRHGDGIRERDEIGIHSIRIGNFAGDHEIMFGTPTQTLTIKHEAHDRAIYAEGALAAAEFICSLPSGSTGVYGMKDLLRRF